MKFTYKHAAILFLLFLGACDTEWVVEPPSEHPDDGVYRIPVVIHVIHLGEPVGEGYNLSRERVESQIRVINEDYRRKPGTRGYNEHPDGGDARIEFVLANTAPDGSDTEGIVRVNMNEVENPHSQSGKFDFYAFYSYWNPEHYLNIWSVPMPGLENLVLGEATGPETDLPGGDEFTPGEPLQAEGVIINASHFGETNTDSDYNLGRTLTHEIGHYLGLLHTWGSNSCENNDYCQDTPPVGKPVLGCPTTPPIGCDGRPVMIENFMNYGLDQCMNTFTNDQIERMHYVLEHSPRRHSLLSSPGL